MIYHGIESNYIQYIYTTTNIHLLNKIYKRIGGGFLILKRVFLVFYIFFANFVFSGFCQFDFVCPEGVPKKTNWLRL